MDRALKLMDEGDYQNAVTLLEQEHAKHPDSPRTTVLLAQANLGLAGFQLLDFAQEISSSREASSEIDLYRMPDCASQSANSIRNLDPRCVLLRIVDHLPQPDDVHLSRARELLRGAYADCAEAPDAVNFLSALVELGSAFARTKLLLERAAWINRHRPGPPRTEDFRFIVHHLKRVFQESEFGLKRIRYTYPSLREYVVKLDGKVLLRVEHSQLAFGEDLSITTLLRFGSDILVNYKDGADLKFDENLPRALVLVLATLDQVYHFGFFRKNVLLPTGFANANVLQWAWDHPPVLLRNLISAFNDSWDNEDPGPLQNYYEELETNPETRTPESLAEGLIGRTPFDSPALH